MFLTYGIPTPSEYREASGEILTPELFPRADGTTWVCAISSTGPLPADPADVAADDAAHARLEALCRNISPVLAAAPIKAWQTCFRPVTEDGLPFIGAVPGVDGAYVATGHSIWGMLNAPATGEALSELILDGACGMAARDKHTDKSDPRSLSCAQVSGCSLRRNLWSKAHRNWLHAVI
jgi:glycine/D-amino acid oxidase-like deaminating enzyme